jgi:hypothetical protein
VIAGLVLVTLNAFAFAGRITSQHPDVLPYFLPTHCLMGKSLIAGQLPAWNPFAMAGAPFASDPQSGWMYLPVMVLYALLPCGAALRWFIVLQPLLAGLGLYAFLRTEGVSRPAATVGGLAIALPLAGSQLVLALPFAAMLGWSSVLLAVTARFLRSTTWSARLGWAAAVGVVWGQLAAAHLSHGLLLGTAAQVAYVLARTIPDIRAGRRSARSTLASLGVLALAMPAVSLAYLLPRIAYLPDTSLGQGYSALRELTGELTGTTADALGSGGAMPPEWPLRLVYSPGLYLGALVVVLCLAGWGSSRHRPIFLAFSLYSLLFYILALPVVADAIAPHGSGSFLAEFFVHEPHRFRYALLLAIPVLAAVGVEGWRESESNLRRALLLVPGIVVWAALPLAFQVEEGPPGYFFLWLAIGLGALAAAVGRPGFVTILPALVAIELTLSALGGQITPAHAVAPGRFSPLLPPSIEEEDFLRQGLIASTIGARRGTRHLSLAPDRWSPVGYHFLQARGDWPLLGMQQSMLFRLEAAQGFNPVQVLGYWSFVRAADPKPIRYNASFFSAAPRVALDLLQVGWVIGAASGPPPVRGAEPVVEEGAWRLYRVPGAAARASLVTSWTVARSPEAALEAVMAEGFDPEALVVLDRDPGIRSGDPEEAGGGIAIYRSAGIQAARVTVNTPAPAVVLIRNAHHRNWRATLDGRPVDLLLADSFLQGVAVPAGRHDIVLEYDDPWIGYGLLGSAVAIWLLLVPAFVLAGRTRDEAT